jgi:hypothetical protein
MNDSPQKPRTARERAFDLFKASAGNLSCAEIYRHLTEEGYEFARGSLDVWKSRDKWNARCPKGSPELAEVDLQRSLMGPRIAGLQEEQRIECLRQAGENLLHITDGLAQKVRQRVESLKPDEIEVKNIDPLVESVGKLIAYCAAIDGEVARRQGEIAKPINPNEPGLIEGTIVLTPLQRAAEEFARRRRER